jgi:hypothetical protein
MRKGTRAAEATWVVALGFILMTSCAYGHGLLDDDFLYLKTVQHLERYDAPILDLGPKERSHLHDLINDPLTANDLYTRDKNVKDALALSLSHQLWEKANPGQRWDEVGSPYRH